MPAAWTRDIPGKGDPGSRGRESVRTPGALAIGACAWCSRCRWRSVRVTRQVLTCVAAETSHAFFLCQQLCAIFFRLPSARLAARRRKPAHKDRRMPPRVRLQCRKCSNGAAFSDGIRRQGGMHASTPAPSGADAGRQCRHTLPPGADMRKRILLQCTNRNCANFSAGKTKAAPEGAALGRVQCHLTRQGRRAAGGQSSMLAA